MTELGSDREYIILGTLSGFGVGRLLGEHEGFVNVDENLLFDDALELLPRESVVLELLQSIRPTEAVVRLCEQLCGVGSLRTTAPPGVSRSGAGNGSRQTPCPEAFRLDADVPMR